MADYNAQQAEFETHYRTLGSVDLTREFHRIRQNHTKENMINDLVKMSALMAVMKEKNVPIPGEAQRQARQSAPQSYSAYSAEKNSASGVNGARMAIGVILMLVGIGLTAASSGGTIFYGAIGVGFFMIISSLAGG
ncbi:MAG: hypothetical protein AAFZ63_29605 [Bacteroidota bacterium]